MSVADRALPLSQRALAMRRMTCGDQSLATLAALELRGRCELEQRQLEQAAGTFEAVVAGRVGLLGKGHVTVGTAMALLEKIQRALGWREKSDAIRGEARTVMSDHARRG
jgi:hypothetical protein